MTQQLDSVAFHRLEHSEVYPGLGQRAFEKKLLLYHYPAFHPYVSWSLFEYHGYYWVRRTVWDRSFWVSYVGPDLRTYGCEQVCSLELGQATFSRLDPDMLQTNKAPTETGIDGVVYGVRLCEAGTLTAVEWWSGSSKLETELARCWNSTVRAFEAILPTSCLKLE